jgi:hypothetical protein
MWTFDLKSQTWSLAQQKGDVPPGRSGHTLVCFKNCLILYGGILEITKESEDMYIFHLSTSTWKMIDVNQGP